MAPRRRRTLRGVVGRDLRKHGREGSDGREKEDPEAEAVHHLGERLPLRRRLLLDVDVRRAERRRRATCT